MRPAISPFLFLFFTKTCRFKCCSHTYKGGKGIAGNGGGGIVKRAAAPPFQGGKRRRKKREERRRKSPLLWVCGLRWLQRDYLGRGAEFTDREETYKKNYLKILWRPIKLLRCLGLVDTILKMQRRFPPLPSYWAGRTAPPPPPPSPPPCCPPKGATDPADQIR